jgi:hypothetical protein
LKNRQTHKSNSIPNTKAFPRLFAIALHGMHVQFRLRATFFFITLVGALLGFARLHSSDELLEFVPYELLTVVLGIILVTFFAMLRAFR